MKTLGKKKALKKRIVGILLIVAMIIAYMPAFGMEESFAAGDIDGGVYDGVPWRITSDYELILGTEGQTSTFTYRDVREEGGYPWSSYAQQITKVDVAGEYSAVVRPLIRTSGTACPRQAYRESANGYRLLDHWLC